MSEQWSAGTFLAKAKELSRRLRWWNVTDFQSPIERVSPVESFELTRRTFRKIVGTGDPGPRPAKMLHLLTSIEPGAEGSRLSASEAPDRDADRTLTQWLLHDFRFHLDGTTNSPALDYLRGAFDQFLELPAWTVRAPGEFNLPGQDDRGISRSVLTGHPVAHEHLDALVDAAEKLLAAPNAPDDPTAYRPAKEFRDDQFPDYRAIQKALSDNPSIRTAKPSRQRLTIHAGDWQKMLNRRSTADPLDLPAEDVDAAVKAVDRRKAEASNARK